MRTLLALAPAAFAALLSSGRARRNAGLLHELSDAQLKDIGLTRSDIGRVTRGHRNARSLTIPADPATPFETPPGPSPGRLPASRVKGAR